MAIHENTQDAVVRGVVGELRNVMRQQMEEELTKLFKEDLKRLCTEAVETILDVVAHSSYDPTQNRFNLVIQIVQEPPK
jgi:pantothenate kinase type III